MPQLLSIGIVTKNRPQKLKKLLELISSWDRNEILAEIIIVDNSDLATTSVANVPLSYHHVKFSVPQARNTIMGQVKTKWIGFLDDDCEPDIYWLERAATAITMHPQAAYLVGNNLLKNPNSYWAQVQYHRHRYWQQKQLKPLNRTIGFHLDTKNCLLNVALLRQKKIAFDDSLQIDGYDNADTDLGFKLERLRSLSYFIENLRVKHPETENLYKVWKKARLRGRLARKLAKKWNLSNEFIDPLRYNFFSVRANLVRNRKYYQDFKKYYQKSPDRRNCLLIFSGIKLYDSWYRSGYLSK